MEVPIAGSDYALRLKAVGMRLANFIPSFSVAATCCTRGVILCFSVPAEGVGVSVPIYNSRHALDLQAV